MFRINLISLVLIVLLSLSTAQTQVQEATDKQRSTPPLPLRQENQSSVPYQIPPIPDANSTAAPQGIKHPNGLASDRNLNNPQTAHGRNLATTDKFFFVFDHTEQTFWSWNSALACYKGTDESDEGSIEPGTYVNDTGFSFTDNQLITVGDSANQFQFSSGFTILTWLYDLQVGPQTVFEVYDVNNPSNKMGIYYQTITSGNLGITMKFEGYGGIDGDVELETYHDNKWGFMQLAFDGTDIYIYVNISGDGVINSAITGTFDDQSITKAFRIGTNASGANPLVGKIWSLAIKNVAVTTEDGFKYDHKRSFFWSQKSALYMSYSRTACSSGEAYYADNCVAFGDRSDPKYDLYFNFRRDFQTIYDDRDSDNWYSFIKGKDPTTFSDGDSEDPGHSDTFGFIFNGSSYLTADFASAIVIDVPITIGLWIQFQSIPSTLRPILFKFDSYNYNYIQLSFDNTKLRFEQYDIKTQTSNQIEKIVALENNFWYYIQIGVIDGTANQKLILQLNDEETILESDTEFAFVGDSSSGPFYIGYNFETFLPSSAIWSIAININPFITPLCRKELDWYSGDQCVPDCWYGDYILRSGVCDDNMTPPNSSETWSASFTFDSEHVTNTNEFISGDFVAYGGIKNVFTDQYIASTIPELVDYDNTGEIFQSDFGYKFTTDGQVINISPQSSFMLHRYFYFTVWFRPTELQTDNIAIIEKRSFDDTQITSISIEDSTVKSYVTRSIEAKELTHSTTIQINEWYSITLRYAESSAGILTYDLYIDGDRSGEGYDEQASSSISYTDLAYYYSFYIGYSRVSNKSIRGYIYQARIQSGEDLYSDVSKLYNTCVSNIHYWFTDYSCIPYCTTSGEYYIQGSCQAKQSPADSPETWKAVFTFEEDQPDGGHPNEAVGAIDYRLFKGLRWWPKGPIDDIPDLITTDVNDSLADADGYNLVGRYESLIIPGDNTMILGDQFSLAAWIKFNEVGTHDFFTKKYPGGQFNIYFTSTLELSVYFQQESPSIDIDIQSLAADANKWIFIQIYVDASTTTASIVFGINREITAQVNTATDGAFVDFKHDYKLIMGYNYYVNDYDLWQIIILPGVYDPSLFTSIDYYNGCRIDSLWRNFEYECLTVCPEGNYLVSNTCTSSLPDYTAEFYFEGPGTLDDYTVTNSNSITFKLLLGLDDTTTNNPTFDETEVGLLYDSDLNSSILVGDTTYQFQDTFTIQAWVLSNYSNTNEQIIVLKDSFDGKTVLKLYFQEGSPLFSLDYLDSNQGAFSITLAGTVDYKGSWVQVTVTSDATKTSNLYINGQTVSAPFTSAPDFVDVTQHYYFAVGFDRQDTTKTFQGHIYNLNLNPSTFSSTQVSDSYNLCRVRNYYDIFGLTTQGGVCRTQSCCEKCLVDFSLEINACVDSNSRSEFEIHFVFDNDTEFYDSKTNSSLYTAYLGYSITADEASDPTYNSSDICLDISPDQYVNVPLFKPYWFANTFYAYVWIQIANVTESMSLFKKNSMDDEKVLELRTNSSGCLEFYKKWAIEQTVTSDNALSATTWYQVGILVGDSNTAQLVINGEYDKQDTPANGDNFDDVFDFYKFIIGGEGFNGKIYSFYANQQIGFTSNDVMNLYNPCRNEYFTGNSCIQDCPSGQWNQSGDCVVSSPPTNAEQYTVRYLFENVQAGEQFDNQNTNQAQFVAYRGLMRKDFADYDADTLPDISVRPDGSDIRSSDEGINFTADKQLINFPADSTFQFSNNSIIIFWIKPNTEVGANSIPIFEKANQDSSAQFLLEIFEDQYRGIFKFKQASSQVEVLSADAIYANQNWVNVALDIVGDSSSITGQIYIDGTASGSAATVTEDSTGYADDDNLYQFYLGKNINEVYSFRGHIYDAIFISGGSTDIDTELGNYYTKCIQSGLWWAYGYCIVACDAGKIHLNTGCISEPTDPAEKKINFIFDHSDDVYTNQVSGGLVYTIQLGAQIQIDEAFDVTTKPSHVSASQAIISSNVLIEAEGIYFPSDVTNKVMTMSPKYAFGIDADSTISFWIRPDLQSADQVLFDKSSQTDVTAQVLIKITTDNKIEASLYWDLFDELTVTQLGELKDTEWQNVAIVMRGDTDNQYLALYHNFQFDDEGSYDISASTHFTDVNDDYILLIGNNTSQEQFTGYIYEISLILGQAFNKYNIRDNFLTCRVTGFWLDSNLCNDLCSVENESLQDGTCQIRTDTMSFYFDFQNTPDTDSNGYSDIFNQSYILRYANPAPVYSNSSHDSTGLEFGPSKHAFIEGSTSFMFQNNFTISVWIISTNLSINQPILHKSSYNGQRYFYLSISNAQVQLSMTYGDSDTQVDVASASDALTQDKWHQIVVTSTTERITQIYVDQIATGSPITSASGDLKDNKQNFLFLIGLDIFDPQLYLQSSLAGIKLLNFAYTGTQVYYQYDACRYNALFDTLVPTKCDASNSCCEDCASGTYRNADQCSDIIQGSGSYPLVVTFSPQSQTYQPALGSDFTINSGYTSGDDGDSEPAYESDLLGLKFTTDKQILTIPPGDSYYFNQEFTMQIWINTSVDSSDSFDVITKASRNLKQLYVLRANSENKWEFERIWNDGQNTYKVAIDDVVQNDWELVTVTSGAENVTTIYVNTVLKKTYSPTDTEMESDIGDDAIFFICNGLIKGFQGLVWEVAFDRIAWSEDIVLAQNICRLNTNQWTFNDCAVQCSGGEFTENNVCVVKQDPDTDQSIWDVKFTFPATPTNPSEVESSINSNFKVYIGKRINIGEDIVEASKPEAIAFVNDGLFRKTDNGYRFSDDDQVINFPASNTYYFGSNFNIFVWVKPDAVADKLSIVEKSSITKNQFIQLQSDDSKYYFAYKMPGDASSNSVESSGDNVLADKWQFIAVTFNTIDDDIQLGLYIDAVQDGSELLINKAADWLDLTKNYFFFFGYSYIDSKSYRGSIGQVYFKQGIVENIDRYYNSCRIDEYWWSGLVCLESCTSDNYNQNGSCVARESVSVNKDLWKLQYTFDQVSDSYDNEVSGGVQYQANVGYKTSAINVESSIDASTKPTLDPRDDNLNLRSTKDGYNFTNDGQGILIGGNESYTLYQSMQIQLWINPSQTDQTSLPIFYRYERKTSKYLSISLQSLQLQILFNNSVGLNTLEFTDYVFPEDWWTHVVLQFETDSNFSVKLAINAGYFTQEKLLEIADYSIQDNPNDYLMYLGYNGEKSFRGHIWQLQFALDEPQWILDFQQFNFCRTEEYWSNYYQCYPLCPNSGDVLVNGVCADSSSISYNASFEFLNDDEKIDSTVNDFSVYNGIDPSSQYNGEFNADATNYGFSFGNRKSLTFGIDNSYIFQKSFSILVWFKNTQSDSSPRVLITKMSNTLDYQITLSVTDTSITFQHDYKGNPSNSTVNITSSGTIVANEWIQAIVTSKSSTERINTNYVNTTSFTPVTASEDADQPDISENYLFFVGKYPGDTTQDFEGSVSTIKFLDYGLDQFEILAQYQECKFSNLLDVKDTSIAQENQCNAGTCCEICENALVGTSCIDHSSLTEEQLEANFILTDVDSEIQDSLVNGNIYKIQLGSSAQTDGNEPVVDGTQGAHDFAGGKQINIPQNYPYRFAETFSILIWVFPKDLTNKPTIILQKTNYEATKVIKVGWDASDKWFVTKIWNGTEFTVTSLGTASVDTWQHVVVSGDANNVTRVFLDGVQNEDDPGQTALFDDVYSQFKFEIGLVLGSNQFNGLIYQVQFLGTSINTENIDYFYSLCRISGLWWTHFECVQICTDNTQYYNITSSDCQPRDSPSVSPDNWSIKFTFDQEDTVEIYSNELADNDNFKAVIGIKELASDANLAASSVPVRTVMDPSAPYMTTEDGFKFQSDGQRINLIGRANYELVLPFQIQVWALPNGLTTDYVPIMEKRSYDGMSILQITANDSTYQVRIKYGLTDEVFQFDWDLSDNRWKQISVQLYEDGSNLMLRSALNQETFDARIVQSDHDFNDARDRYSFFLGYSSLSKKSFLGNLYQIIIFNGQFSDIAHNECRSEGVWFTLEQCITICATPGEFYFNACAAEDLPSVSPEQWEVLFVFDSPQPSYTNSHSSKDFVIDNGLTIGGVADASTQPDYVTDQGFHFTDDGQLLNVNPKTTYYFEDQFTIFLWVNPSDNEGVKRPILQKQSYNNENLIDISYQTTGKVSFTISQDGADNATIESSYILTVNKWVRIAVQLQSQVISLFINGFTASTSTTTASFIDVKESFIFHIGKGIESTSFRGLIFELKMSQHDWKYEYIGSEVNQCMSQTTWNTYVDCETDCADSEARQNGSCVDITPLTWDVDFIFNQNTTPIIESGNFTLRVGATDYNLDDSEYYKSPSFAQDEGYYYNEDNQCIIFSEDDSYVFQNSFSISVWVQPEFTDAVQRPIFSKVSSVKDGNQIQLSADETNFNFYIKWANGEESGLFARTNDKWQQVVLTLAFDGTDQKEYSLYINGEQKVNQLQTDSSELNDPAGKYKLFIGMNSNGVSWRGNIYQVTLKSSALSSSEISSNFVKCRLVDLWDDGNKCSKICEQVADTDFKYNVNRECQTKPDFAWNARFIFESIDSQIITDQFGWLKSFLGNSQFDESAEQLEPTYENGFKFNGALQRVSISGENSYVFQPEFTIVMWFDPDQASQAYLLQKKQDDFNLSIKTDNNSLTFDLAWKTESATIATDWTGSTWIQAIITKDNGTPNLYKLYINGEHKNTEESTPTVEFKDDYVEYSFLIAYSTDGAWAGVVYELGLYEGVQTPLIIRSQFDDCILIDEWNDGIKCQSLCPNESEAIVNDTCGSISIRNQDIVFDLDPADSEYEGDQWFINKVYDNSFEQSSLENPNYVDDQGWNFDADGQQLNATPKTVYIFNSEFTVKVWVKPFNQGDTSERPVFTKKSYDQGTKIMLQNNNSYYRFTLKWSDDDDFNIRSYDDSSVDESWQEVIATYSGGKFNIYINGQPAAEEVTVTPTKEFKDVKERFRFFIGYDYDTQTSLKGHIWRISLLHTVLTTEEISSAYNICRFDTLWWSTLTCISQCEGQVNIDGSCQDKDSPSDQPDLWEAQFYFDSDIAAGEAIISEEGNNFKVYNGYRKHQDEEISNDRLAVFEDGDNTVSARGDSTTFSNADSRLNMAGDTTYVIEDELTLLLWTYPLNNTGNECLFEKSLNDNSVVFSLRASSTNFTFQVKGQGYTPSISQSYTNNSWNIIMITYNQSDTQIKLNAWVNNVKATEVPIDITNKIQDSRYNYSFFIGSSKNGEKYSGYLYEFRMWAKVLSDLYIDSFYDRDCWHYGIWDTWNGCAAICASGYQLRRNECTEVNEADPIHVKWIFVEPFQEYPDIITENEDEAFIITRGDSTNTSNDPGFIETDNIKDSQAEEGLEFTLDNQRANLSPQNALVLGEIFTMQFWVMPYTTLDSTFRVIMQKRTRDLTRLVEVSSNNQAYKFTMKWPASNDYSLQTDDGTVTQTSWQLVTVTTLTEGGGDRRMKIYIEDEMKKETLIPLTDQPFGDYKEQFTFLFGQDYSGTSYRGLIYSIEIWAGEIKDDTALSDMYNKCRRSNLYLADDQVSCGAIIERCITYTSDRSGCLECESGYQYNGTICMDCSVSNCKQCSSDSKEQCQTCKDTFVLSENKAVCSSSCAAGFRLENQNCVRITEIDDTNPARELNNTAIFIATFGEPQTDNTYNGYSITINGGALSCNRGVYLQGTNTIESQVILLDSSFGIHIALNKEAGEMRLLCYGYTDCLILAQLNDTQVQLAVTLQKIDGTGSQVVPLNYNISQDWTVISIQVSTAMDNGIFKSTVSLYEKGQLLGQQVAERLVFVAEANSILVLGGNQGASPFVGSVGYLFINSGDTGPAMNWVSENTLYNGLSVIDCPLNKFNSDCSRTCRVECSQGCTRSGDCSCHVDPLCSSYDNFATCKQCTDLAELKNGVCGCVSNATEYWNANTRRKECRCKEDFVPSSNECIGQGAYFTNDDVETFFIDRKVTTLTITLKDSANYPSGQGCKELFDEDSVALFGTNTECKWAGTKQINVTLTLDNKLKDGTKAKQTITMKSHSFTKLNSQTLIKYQPISKKPDYEALIQPNNSDLAFNSYTEWTFACQDKQSMELQAKVTKDNQNYIFEWSVSGTFTTALQEEVARMNQSNSKSLKITDTHANSGTLTVGITLSVPKRYLEDQSITPISKENDIIIANEVLNLVQFVDGPLIYRDADKWIQVQGKGIYCTDNQVTFEWTYDALNSTDSSFDQSAGDLLVANNADKDILSIPPYTFNPGFCYSFQLKVSSPDIRGAQAGILICISIADMELYFSKQSQTIGKDQDLSFTYQVKDTSSQDGTLPGEEVSIESSCIEEPVDSRRLLSTRNLQQIQIFMTGNTVNIPQDQLRVGYKYTVTLTVTKTNVLGSQTISRSATNQETFIVVEDSAVQLNYLWQAERFNKEEVIFIPIEYQGPDDITVQWDTSYCPRLASTLLEPLLYITFDQNTFDSGDICELLCNITIKDSSVQYQITVKITINKGPICGGMALSNNTVNLFQEATATLNDCFDGDGKDLPLTFECGTNSAINSSYFLGSSTSNNIVKFYPLAGASYAYCKVCDSLQQCIQLEQSLTVIFTSEYCTEEILNQLISLNTRNPEDTFAFVINAAICNQELSVGFISQLVSSTIERANQYKIIDEDLFIRICYAYEVLAAQKNATIELVDRMFDSIKQTAQKIDIIKPQQTYKAFSKSSKVLLVHYKTKEERVKGMKQNVAIAQILQNGQNILPLNKHSQIDQPGFALRARGQSLNGAIITLDNGNVQFPSKINNNSNVIYEFSIHISCAKDNQDQSERCYVCGSCKEIGIYAGNKLSYNQSKNCEFNDEQIQILIQRDNSGNNKIIEYGALLCEGANGDPCEVASITDSEIVIKSRVMTEFLIEVADTESAKSSQFIELDESQSEDCEQCYGPIWTSLGIFITCLIILAILVVLNGLKRQSDEQNSIELQNSVNRDLQNVDKQGDNAVVKVQSNRSFRTFLKHHQLLGSILLKNPIKRVYSFLILTSNLIVEIMVLGLLYNTYLDATESSKYYENNDDVIEDYNVNDFLLTLGACAINQPLTYAMLYLLLNQKKNEKRWYTILGLAINVTMISIAWIVIPILTTSYCCEASAMWAFGIIFIVLVEIIVFETLHALMRYFLKVKV